MILDQCTYRLECSLFEHSSLTNGVSPKKTFDMVNDNAFFIKYRKRKRKKKKKKDRELERKREREGGREREQRILLLENLGGDLYRLSRVQRQFFRLLVI